LRFDGSLLESRNRALFPATVPAYNLHWKLHRSRLVNVS
jgi:hypothetical protein